MLSDAIWLDVKPLTMSELNPAAWVEVNALICPDVMALTWVVLNAFNWSVVNAMICDVVSLAMSAELMARI